MDDANAIARNGWEVAIVRLNWVEAEAY